MLVSPKLKYDLELMGILSLMGQGGRPEEVEEGIFMTNSFSFNHNIADKIDQYFYFETDEEYLGSYGVCDNVNQVTKKYKKWLDDPNLKFCISFTKVKKSDQPEDGGWRWHKWGEYIGDKNPQYEYLYDEGDDIQEVYVYHIYHLID